MSGADHELVRFKLQFAVAHLPVAARAIVDAERRIEPGEFLVPFRRKLHIERFVDERRFAAPPAFRRKCRRSSPSSPSLTTNGASAAPTSASAASSIRRQRRRSPFHASDRSGKHHRRSEFELRRFERFDLVDRFVDKPERNKPRQGFDVVCRRSDLGDRGLRQRRLVRRRERTEQRESRRRTERLRSASPAAQPAPRPAAGRLERSVIEFRR